MRDYFKIYLSGRLEPSSLLLIHVEKPGHHRGRPQAWRIGAASGAIASDDSYMNSPGDHVNHP